MNKTFRNFLMVTSLFASGILSGCERDEPEVENTPVQPMSGEWYVHYATKNAAGNWQDQGSYSKIITSNTSDNASDKMWIGDIFGDPRMVASTGAGEFYTYMVKANVDLGAMTFNANDKSIVVVAPKAPTAANPNGVPAKPYDIVVKINEGKIIKGGSTPPSGAVTDSIYFLAEFEDDPGTIYRVSGYKRTGFLEDEH